MSRGRASAAARTYTHRHGLSKHHCASFFAVSKCPLSLQRFATSPSTAAKCLSSVSSISAYNIFVHCIACTAISPVMRPIHALMLAVAVSSCIDTKAHSTRATPAGKSAFLDTQLGATRFLRGPESDDDDKFLLGYTKAASTLR